MVTPKQRLEMARGREKANYEQAFKHLEQAEDAKRQAADLKPEYEKGTEGNDYVNALTRYLSACQSEIWHLREADDCALRAICWDLTAERLTPRKPCEILC